MGPGRGEVEEERGGARQKFFGHTCHRSRQPVGLRDGNTVETEPGPEPGTTFYFALKTHKLS